MTRMPARRAGQVEQPSQLTTHATVADLPVGVVGRRPHLPGTRRSSSPVLSGRVNPTEYDICWEVSQFSTSWVLPAESARANTAARPVAGPVTGQLTQRGPDHRDVTERRVS
jgi:hypothetical protein